MGETLGPLVIDLRLAAGGMLQCQTALHLRLGDDQIRQAFDLDKIHLAVLKGAS
ncbi:hypothetical protein D9M72_592020 [compost metagenome]